MFTMFSTDAILGIRLPADVQVVPVPHYKNAVERRFLTLELDYVGSRLSPSYTAVVLVSRVIRDRAEHR